TTPRRRVSRKSRNDGGFEALKLDDGRESGAGGRLAYWKRLREEIE
ncbi:hypothetical protein A2U01_0095221, partial [Trifolium medium]|nr:hypothetical protein [Trifolium medium]